jgi:hypothetical protein
VSPLVFNQTRWAGHVSGLGACRWEVQAAAAASAKPLYKGGECASGGMWRIVHELRERVRGSGREVVGAGPFRRSGNYFCLFGGARFYAQKGCVIICHRVVLRKGYTWYRVAKQGRGPGVIPQLCARPGRWIRARRTGVCGVARRATMPFGGTGRGRGGGCCSRRLRRR